VLKASPRLVLSEGPSIGPESKPEGADRLFAVLPGRIEGLEQPGARPFANARSRVAFTRAYLRQCCYLIHVDFLDRQGQPAPGIASRAETSDVT
jgi:hypothetical protein